MLSLARKFNEFLEEAGRGSDDFPKSLDKLSAAGIRLVQADSNDPDGVACMPRRHGGPVYPAILPCGGGRAGRVCFGVGFVQWRVAWYVAGEDGDCVLNFLALWDDFMVSKSKAMAKDVECHFYPHKGFDCLEQSKVDDMNYEHYTLHDPAEESELPLKWNEAAPCIGKRVLTYHLTAENETQLKFIWSGNTWAFRDAMDEYGIKGLAVVVVCALVCCNCALARMLARYSNTSFPKASFTRPRTRRRHACPRLVGRSFCIARRPTVGWRFGRAPGE